MNIEVGDDDSLATGYALFWLSSRRQSQQAEVVQTIRSGWYSRSGLTNSRVLSLLSASRRLSFFRACPQLVIKIAWDFRHLDEFDIGF